MRPSLRQLPGDTAMTTYTRPFAVWQHQPCDDVSCVRSSEWNLASSLLKPLPFREFRFDSQHSTFSHSRKLQTLASLPATASVRRRPPMAAGAPRSAEAAAAQQPLAAAPAAQQKADRSRRSQGWDLHLRTAPRHSGPMTSQGNHGSAACPLNPRGLAAL